MLREAFRINWVRRLASSGGRAWRGPHAAAPGAARTAPEGAAGRERSARWCASAGAAASAAATVQTHNKPFPPPLSRAPWEGGDAPRWGQEKLRRGRVRAGAEETSSPAQLIAPRLPPGGGHSPRTAGPGCLERKHCRTEAAPASPGVREAGATPALQQARSPAQRRQAPRSLQSPRRDGCWARRGVRARAAAPQGRPARTSEAVCQAEIHPPPAGGKRRKVSPPSARRRRAQAAAAPRRNYAIRTRRGLSPPAGSSGNRAGKVAGHGSRRLPSLTHWEEESAAPRPRNPRLPPSGRPSAPALPHTRAGTGRAPQQSARGGKGAPPPRPHRGLRAAEKLLLPPPASSLLPLFLPGRWMSPERCLSQRFPSDRGGRKRRSARNRRAAARPGWGGGWGSQSSEKSAGVAGAGCRDSLLQTRSSELSRALWRSGIFIWFPLSCYKSSKTFSNLITPLMPTP